MFWSGAVPDLVEVPGDGDLQGEVGAGGQRRVLLPLLGAPVAVLEAVGDDVGMAVVTRVKMEGDVRPAPGAALEVHIEPGEHRPVQTSKNQLDSYWADVNTL